MVEATDVRTYVVKAGDSPWTISVAFTGGGARWGELIAANPGKPRARDGNFKTLFPGEVLNIPDAWTPDAGGRVSPIPSPATGPSSGAGALGPADPNATTPLDFFATDAALASVGRADLQKKNPRPGRWLTRDDFLALLELARDTQQNPANLALLMFNESLWVPWNTGGDAFGNQNVTAGISQLVGLTNGAEVRAQSAAEQLRGVIHAQYVGYVKQFGLKANATAEQLYAFNAAPARARNGADGDVLYSAAPDDWAYVNAQSKLDPKKRVYHSHEQGRYASNFGLDVNRDGLITIADLRTRLQQDARNVLFGKLLAAINFVARENAIGPFAPTFGGVPGAPSNVPPGAGTPLARGSGGGGLGLLALLFFVAWGAS